MQIGTTVEYDYISVQSGDAFSQASDTKMITIFSELDMEAHKVAFG